MIIVTNLADPKREMHFEDGTDPYWAVAYAWAEDNNRKSWLFQGKQNNKFSSILAELPIWAGQCSIACGDWATVYSMPTEWDDFTEQHFQNWLDGQFEDEKDLISAEVRRLVADYPDLIGCRSWNELRDLAKRNRQ